MTPQTLTTPLTTDRAHVAAAAAYNANTLIVTGIGDLTGFTSVKVELHNTAVVGRTPLAEVEYVGTPGVGPHSFTFTAAQMNQLAASEGVPLRRFWLVVLARSGSGASMVKSVLALINLTLFAAPAGDTPAPPPVPASYVTDEELAALEARVVAIEGAGGVTNLSYSTTSTTLTVVSSSGNDATLPSADGSNAGIFTAAQFTKLAGIATGATANSTDAHLKDRANHTGTQAISTVVNLQTELDSLVKLDGTRPMTGTLTFSGAGHPGLRLNNLTTIQRDLFTPLAGFIIWNTTTTQAEIYSGTAWVAVGSGSGGGVTSVAASGGTTGLTFSGGPITTSGTLTLAGTLALANGGTGATTAALARTNLGLKIFYPNGTDRAAVQDALDAAEAAGGGIVQLDYGTYTITTVNSPASGDKAAGAYGLEIPSNVILQGMGDGTLLSIVAGGAFGVGCGISPKGMRTATTDYGASTGVILRDFKIMASAQDDSSGNLLNLVHASYWLVYNVNIGGSLHHGVEIDQSKYIMFRNCRFSGSYSSPTSGSWIQFDYGLAGPCNRPVTITTKTVQDVMFEDCVFMERPVGDTSNREIDMTHNASDLILERITFRNCHFTFRNQASLACIYFDASSGTTASKLKNIIFERNTFVSQHSSSTIFSLADNTGRQIEGIRIRDNVFTGKSGAVIWMFGSSSATTAYATTYRRGLEITGNTFYYDKTALPVSADYILLAIHQWAGLVIRDNKIFGLGDFGAGVNGTNYCSVMRLGNNIDMIVEGNEIIWEGNNVTVGRTAIYISQEAVDQAGNTVRTVVNRNNIKSAVANWSYGILLQSGTTVPSTRVFSLAGNFSNGASSAANQILYTGPTGSGTASAAATAPAVRSVSASTTLTQQDSILRCDTTSGTITVTQLNAAYRQSFQLIKTAAANSLTCGSTTVTGLNAMIFVYSDGTTNFTMAVQPWDADLQSLADAASTDVIYYRSAAGVWTPVTIGANITFTGGTLSGAAGVGSGTVTTVSVVTANGVSGSVATATTTPAITITLGAITPTSVNGLTITTTTGTLTVTNGKTLSVSNTLTLAGTDGSTLNIGAGGTLGTAAFSAKSTGGNGATDSGKVAQYDTDGSLTVTTQLRVNNASTATHCTLADDGTIDLHIAGETNPRSLAFPDDILENEAKIGATRTWVTAGYSPLAGSSSITTVGTVTTGTWLGDIISPVVGGTGRASHTAYAPICGGTTSSSAQQSMAGPGTAGQVIKSAGASAVPVFADDIGTIHASIEASAGIAVGKLKGFAVMSYAGTLVAYSAVVDTGTITFKVWKIASGTAKPTAANSINTSGVGVSSGTANVLNTTLTDFTTTAFAVGDILAVEVTAVSGTPTEASLDLKIRKA